MVLYPLVQELFVPAKLRDETQLVKPVIEQYKNRRRCRTNQLSSAQNVSLNTPYQPCSYTGIIYTIHHGSQSQANYSKAGDYSLNPYCLTLAYYIGALYAKMFLFTQ